eukprot:6016848-Amphidinium_carterae.1
MGVIVRAPLRKPAAPTSCQKVQKPLAKAELSKEKLRVNMGRKATSAQMSAFLASWPGKLLTPVEVCGECEHFAGLHTEASRVQKARECLSVPPGYCGSRRARFVELLRQGVQGPEAGCRRRETAAYFHRIPQHSRKAGVGMPRMPRALVSWSHLLPTETRVAPPHVVVLALAQRLVEVDRPVMTLAVLVAHLAYLRPGELMKLRGKSFGVGPPTLESATVPVRQPAAFEAYLRRCGPLGQPGLRLFRRPIRRAKERRSGAPASVAFLSPKVAGSFSECRSGILQHSDLSQRLPISAVCSSLSYFNL